MNGLQSRNVLHHFNVRHAGTMPEQQAIKRADTVREAKHAGIEFTDDEGPTGAAVVWGLGALVVAVVVLALWLAK